MFKWKNFLSMFGIMMSLMFIGAIASVGGSYEVTSGFMDYQGTHKLNTELINRIAVIYFVLFFAISLLSYYKTKYSKVAFVLLTIMTLFPPVWIYNIFYIYNRWKNWEV